MKAELITSMGNDLLVVNAARVSMDKESSYDEHHDDHDGFTTSMKGSDKRLLSYLARESHWTPFSHVRETFLMGSSSVHRQYIDENMSMGLVIDAYDDGTTKMRHSLWGWAAILKRGCLTSDVSEHIAITLGRLYPECWKAMGMSTPEVVNRDTRIRHRSIEDEEDPRFIDITMRETVPIFVARQRFKHMVGFTYNEVSRRYVDTPPEFYTPDVWRSRPEGSIKQGSGDKEVTRLVDEDEYGCRYSNTTSNEYQEYLGAAGHLYNLILKNGVAPEQARMVLPQSMYTSYYVTGSLAAWARAYKQRSDDHSQLEIQDLAVQWDSIIAPLFPESWGVLTQ